MFRRKPPETLLLDADAPSTSEMNADPAANSPLAEPVAATGGGAASQSIQCACPPSHVRLRKALFTIVMVLIVLIALAGAFVIWTSQH